MARAPKICPSCSNVQPCPTHTPKPWQGSTRHTRTVSGSRQQKRARFVMQRDEAICHVCGAHAADEVDHVVPLAEGGPDTVDNMAPIHRTPCHRAKTQAEALRGRT